MTFRSPLLSAALLGIVLAAAPQFAAETPEGLLTLSPEEIAPEEALVLDLEGYEGPLHVLLALARSQKVDLLHISITRLAEQYLAFIKAARKLRFSLAADYLVMASWLAYLKSRLLLPRTERKSGGDETSPEDLAMALAFRAGQLQARRMQQQLPRGPPAR